jgi:aspartokinase
MKPLVYKVFTTPGMARTAHSRKRITLNVVLSDIGKITQGETDQLVALFDEAQQTALANDILAKRAQAAEEEVTNLKRKLERLRAAAARTVQAHWNSSSDMDQVSELQEALKDDQ